MKKNLLYLFILSAFMSCTNRLTPNKGEKSYEKITEYSEDLSVFLPKYETENSTEEIVEVPKKQEKPKDSNPKKIKNENVAVDAVLDQMKEKNLSVTDGKGYRIQVFSGNNKSDFESARNYLLRYFPELELYESYSQPTYKIKVGDFINVDQADKYIANLKSKFGTARIIGDKINVKKAINIK
ncbi:SPOR domain-containing protein [Lacihabitans sp. LS3-19]|uniref:SPOR domain-containing protein n=1 Tax=Lacihabitans sp. LS3-19 TaxID=2487335 RepID=UPI0020CE3A69|nr:SPOR domain-containing protein [Lacihabitans sp. LS3-19]MCP9769177.1 SPOR domain-containing protein [Lacihabitans sp. LS3-19]